MQHYTIIDNIRPKNFEVCQTTHFYIGQRANVEMIDDEDIEDAIGDMSFAEAKDDLSNRRKEKV